MTQETYLQQGRQKWENIRSDQRVRQLAGVIGYGMTGFLASAAGLGASPQPLALGLICAVTGWRTLAMAVGSILGYRAVWGSGGEQGVVWSLGGCLAALVLGKRQLHREGEWLLPAVAALVVSVSGLIFQMLAGDQTPVPVYLLRVVTAGVSTWLWRRIFRGASLGDSGERMSQRYDAGAVQVRLEIIAGVLTQTRQLLLEVAPTPVDEDALLARTRERACGSCPNRKGCTESAMLTAELLHRPLTDTSSLNVPCRKPNRLILELRRSQEQLRMLKAQGSQRQECRSAVIQQYWFLADYLRKLSDELNKRHEKIRLNFKAEVQIVTLGKESANGDRCQAFSGVGGRYYVLLCDGMGTGMGAAQEGQTAMTMLRQMLTAGFPADHALRSVNSLCCLRGRAGAVTLDLAEIQLDTGKAALYKWGAAPSVVLRGGMAEKIGTAGPPPGLSVNETRETVDRLSLRRGEALILMSDGVDGEGVLRCGWIAPGEPLGEYAAKLLDICSEDGADDATVAAIRLHPTSLST